METLGQFLKREREFRGVSLEDLSKGTKIRVGFLKTIEEDRLESLPKGAFVKGFLKSYAQRVGLNADEILSRYQQLSAGEIKVQEDPFKKFRKFEVKNQVVLIILFLVIVIVLATFLSSR